MLRTYLDFEKTVAEIDGRLARLAAGDDERAARAGGERQRLEARLQRALHQAYRRLAPWQKVQVARHPDRPCASVYLDGLAEEFVALPGDPLLPCDPGLIGGLGRIRGWSAVILAQVKRAGGAGGAGDVDGLTGAAGYRRAERLLRLANRLGMPVVTLVDTPASGTSCDPGRGAAIAGCVEAALELRAPAVAVVVGEAGGSDAHALCIADRVFMLEHAVAYPAAPEIVAAKLWKDAGQVRAAAEALKLTAQDQEMFGFVDGVVREPLGGAHRDPAAAVAAVGDAVATALEALVDVPGADLRRRRRDRFAAVGGPDRA